MKERGKAFFKKIFQASYITGRLFAKNDLDSCACACAFGFLFSFLPLLLMILSILLRVAHASSDAVREAFENIPGMRGFFDIEKILDSVSESNTFSIVDLILGVWIFWMARNLFVYIQKGITRIFHKAQRPRPVLNQILIFSGEIILVLGATAVVLLSISLKTMKTLPVISALENSFPKISWIQIFKTAHTIPSALLFTSVFLAYKFYTGTRPRTRLCLFAAALCTASFMVTAFFLNLFINIDRYNLIYGILGNLIVLLLEVKIFFYLFYVFAEYIFVIQFFEKTSAQFAGKERKNKIERVLFGEQSEGFTN